MKKIGLFCVVLALILSAVSPACAAGTDGGQTVITALCELPEISVVVPATAEGFINPYEMPVTIESGESTAQIISTPACIENQSEVPLRIGVTVTAKVWEGSSLFLSGTSTGGTGTLKRAFVYFEMQASDTAVPPDSIWDAEYDPAKHIIVRPFEMPEKKLAILSAADGDAPYGAFRLSGDCTASPREAWTEDDGIDVKIAFTFTALPTWTEIP